MQRHLLELPLEFKNQLTWYLLVKQWRHSKLVIEYLVESNGLEFRDRRRPLRNPQNQVSLRKNWTGTSAT